MGNAIEGVSTIALKQIHDERGKVMTMLREDSDYFRQFGEIYFSTVNPGAVKAWHKHHLMTLNYACIFGAIKLVLYDSRDGSSTFGETTEYFISPENYWLISVPPGVWNGFKAVGPSVAMVANCSTLPHDPKEIERVPFDDPSIPYNWEIAHG